PAAPIHTVPTGFPRGPTRDRTADTYRKGGPPWLAGTGNLKPSRRTRMRTPMRECRDAGQSRLADGRTVVWRPRWRTDGRGSLIGRGGRWLRWIHALVMLLLFVKPLRRVQFEVRARDRSRERRSA